MESGHEGPSGAAPGWFPDPWGRAPYRWWDGRTWTGAEWPPPGPAPAGGRGPVRAALVAAGILLCAWAGIWVLLFPAMLVSDADNGQFGHDFATKWLPEVGLALIGAAACWSMAHVLRRRALPLWQAVAPPMVSVILLAIVSVFAL